ncbi:hypothetical protein PO903_14225 [Paenibacillus sp. PK4536]|uniref:Uncharacterized protein n=1 Tax=Paenibacillus nuruki TaxID=1886670 RepID=A0A1E3L6P1_9BACL|nr:MULTISPECIES: hypothetical protein [Paenibacillus]ODP28640.1 hypothetical protein PTI45_01935 [Paenibacillus nuruki]TKJ91576.1 hypothetical protein PaeCFBP13512_09570 [Paenibacillus sp. CFBP13512]WIM37807.1 hypothetical protein PO903_14225 [Paenibacillus sp. PK4536]CAJ1315545.1 Swarming motility protein SwrB [Paenibacillus nuruki]
MNLPGWIYIVLIGAVAIVYGFLLPKARNVAATAQSMATVDKVEDTLEHYMAEIEKENEEIIDLVSKIKQESTAKQLALQEQLTEMRQRLIQLEQKPDPVIMPSAVPPVATMQNPAYTQTQGTGTQGDALRESAARMAQQYSEPVVEEQPDTTERIQDRYQELFALYENGKSIDTIAKTVGLQRGEVQLILQLAKQEDHK